MGHQRLGEIPKTHSWSAVVTAVSEGASGERAVGGLSRSVEDIAAHTLDAAGAGLEKAASDSGLRFTFYLLTQIVLAAREADWRDRLSDLGISLSKDSSLFDLTAGLQGVIDAHVMAHGKASDVTEMAQEAAGEAIAVLAGPDARTLFGSGSAELQDAVRRLSTKAGFARLGQRFFGCFMTRFLNFYLSRVTAGETHVSDISRFNERLANHCNESARIVHDFCGEWYSKTEFEKGITAENSSAFIVVALTKLQAELIAQREGL